MVNFVILLPKKLLTVVAQLFLQGKKNETAIKYHKRRALTSLLIGPRKRVENTSNNAMSVIIFRLASQTKSCRRNELPSVILFSRSFRFRFCFLLFYCLRPSRLHYWDELDGLSTNWNLVVRAPAILIILFGFETRFFLDYGRVVRLSF